jgi:hypothetical protein
MAIRPSASDIPRNRVRRLAFWRSDKVTTIQRSVEHYASRQQLAAWCAFVPCWHDEVFCPEG